MLEHIPVLLEEVLVALEVHDGGCYLDATFGRGGHTAAILERIGIRGRVIALDRDAQAIRAGQARFAGDARLRLVGSPFARIAEVARANGVTGGVDGVLLDLGVSSPQLDEAARGFSFAHDGPLDMRMDTGAGMTAEDFLARAGEREIASVLKEFGEERFAGRIARAIVAARMNEPLTRTAQLAEIIARAVPGREPGKHPATRSFQALRILVNGELEQLEAGLAGTLEVLAPGGRLCAISFHSLEDGIVKRFIAQHSQVDPVFAGLPVIPPHARPKLRRIGRTVHPGAAEVARNPRARSALLRAAERVTA
jgi:16S rRNA (cytosine1402-N4)-methyltransferase